MYCKHPRDGLCFHEPSISVTLGLALSSLLATVSAHNVPVASGIEAAAAAGRSPAPPPRPGAAPPPAAGPSAAAAPAAQDGADVKSHAWAQSITQLFQNRFAGVMRGGGRNADTRLLFRQLRARLAGDLVRRHPRQPLPRHEVHAEPDLRLLSHALDGPVHLCATRRRATLQHAFYTYLAHREESRQRWKQGRAFIEKPSRYKQALCWTQLSYAYVLLLSASLSYAAASTDPQKQTQRVSASTVSPGR